MKERKIGDIITLDNGDKVEEGFPRLIKTERNI
jgi:hypothetical protein